MTQEAQKEPLSKLYEGLPPVHNFDFETRDYVYFLGVDFVLEAQMIAVRQLLARNRQSEQETTDEIKAISEQVQKVTGFMTQHVIDCWVDQMEASTYQDAAHSMAAVGMLAPMIETIFHQCFLGIQREYYPSSDPENGHVRWVTKDRHRWDCHYMPGENGFRKANVVDGIIQLNQALDLDNRMPEDLTMTLTALFAYRNKMFHNGFEWPERERAAFAKRIIKEKWPSDWFSCATSGGEPWICFMSNGFVEHCLKTIDGVVEAMGQLVRDELEAKNSKQ